VARSSSGFVAGLTAAAVATVGFLAYQAQASVPPSLKGAHGATASPTPAPTKAPRDQRHPAALPAGSGTGERVVNSVDDDRVWLVSASGRVENTFTVSPGSVDPLPGTYAVTSRSKAVTGSDGAQIEHVVRFTVVDGVAIGFSSAIDGSTGSPDSTKKLGGIRETRKNGTAMWNFATVGVKVVVIR